ncbi:SCO family protein [Leptospira kobayashii]|uniref:SCO family protein n=1 Tax=Leptospira kobayashii TaxID=1917830 RepID=A0ABM7UKA8_9LEPT|nr:SCO family protein [Leptospira kobayashii]BDA79266.1 SCO family protein [Leptospira kobayashii]
MKFTIFIFLIFYMTISSCKEESHHLGTDHSLPSGVQTQGSLFELDENWTLPGNQTFRLAELKEKPFLISMFYSSCQSVCPRIIDDLKRISGEIKKKTNQSPKIVLVSFDPEKDTPERLKEYHSKMKLDSDWYLLHGKEEQVRTLSVILGINYKKLGSGDFNHSAIISLISKEGNILTRVEGIGASIDPILNGY